MLDTIRNALLFSIMRGVGKGLIQDITYKLHKALKAIKELKSRNWDTGSSVACSSGESSSSFTITEVKFVQMDPVVEDQRTWSDPSDYCFSDRYNSRDSALKTFIVQNLIVPKVNKLVKLDYGSPVYHSHSQ